MCFQEHVPCTAFVRALGDPRAAPAAQEPRDLRLAAPPPPQEPRAQAGQSQQEQQQRPPAEQRAPGKMNAARPGHVPEPFPFPRLPLTCAAIIAPRAITGTAREYTYFRPDGVQG